MKQRIMGYVKWIMGLRLVIVNLDELEALKRLRDKSHHLTAYGKKRKA